MMADLANLSVTTWLVLILCAGVIGMFAGACIGGERDD